MRKAQKEQGREAIGLLCFSLFERRKKKKEKRSTAETKKEKGKKKTLLPLLFFLLFFAFQTRAAQRSLPSLSSLEADHLKTKERGTSSECAPPHQRRPLVRSPSSPLRNRAPIRNSIPLFSLFSLN